jgi:hypothetical protein
MFQNKVEVTGVKRLALAVETSPMPIEERRCRVSLRMTSAPTAGPC